MSIQVNKSIDAVRTTVPHEMWGDILRKLDKSPCPTHVAENTDFYDMNDDEAYSLDPGDIVEFDDEVDYDSDF